MSSRTFCTSSNQTEFPAEVNIHFPDLRNGQPGVFVFPDFWFALIAALPHS